ncbi:hypothetical protein [Nannocystis pusilla]|uniref:hypothetical protein n=1 Tax=Nannocystis pusilla TaxID=889268 RepID=UPI003B7C35AD
MKLHRTRPFLRAYGLLPHRLLGAVTRTLMRARRPRWAVRAAIEVWIRRGAIDVSECVEEPWPTLEAFFLRRLRPGRGRSARGSSVQPTGWSSGQVRSSRGRSCR